MSNSTSSSYQHSFGIYNPGSLSPEVLLDEFIARKHQLNQALDIVRANASGQPQQHLIVLGPRGIGKTTFLLALAYKMERDSELFAEWLPVIFPEEMYGIGDLADFWLATVTQLLQTLDLEHEIDEVERLRDSDPEDLEEQARELMISHIESCGKRVMLVLENLNDFFDSVSDEAEQHRLRAFLMEDDRLMIAGSSPSYFDATGQMDQPFYDFFRTIRLGKFKNDEMIEILSHLAELRGDSNVQEVIEKQPERIKSLHVLTGGNPRLVKMIYRLLSEGGTGTAREDLDRLLEDCTPYFKHRIEELSKEERRVFDHVARHWDPIAVGDIQKALRRPSNRVSIYLRRLVNEGFIEEAEASTPKRKFYQVAERFYNIYYLMRFTRSGKKRLSWLIVAMRALYSADDFESWTEKTLENWKSADNPATRGDREAFLYSMTCAADSAGMQSKMMEKVIQVSWDSDRLNSLDRILDRQLASKTLGKRYELIDYMARLSADEKEEVGYKPDSAEWWFNLGVFLYEKGQRIFSEQAYRESIGLDESDLRSWNNLGVVLIDLGRIDEAELAYRTAIELDADYGYAWYGLGVVLSNLGRTDESEQAFHTAIKLDANDEYAWNGLGNVLNDLGRTEESEHAYRTAIELDSNYASAWNGLGKILNDLGRAEESEQAFRTAIKLDANYTNAWNGLGNVLRDLGRTEEAEQAYRTAIQLDANDAYPYAGLAALMGLQGRKEEACASAVKAVNIHPSLWWARFQFIEQASQDGSAWLEILPSLLQTIASSKQVNEGFYEFVVQGMVFLISSRTLNAEQLLKSIEEHGAKGPLDEIHFALRVLDSPELLSKASPESKIFTRDFIARVFPE